MDKLGISKATLGRLPHYLQFLRELSVDDVPYISATVIAKKLSLGEVQVRKDLSAVSGAGKPKVGYKTTDLIKSIEAHLGLGDMTNAVLVGAGKLGKALLEFDDFEDYGVKIIAAFDCNETAIRYNRSIEILPMNDFDEYCKQNNVRIGIITVGEGSAQSVCDKMIESGITAIWNFAPCNLELPDGILLKQERLALSLAYLNNKLSIM
ncbi:MAG: redox-sensing transcriptional repressor Rex [Acutalibacteraceae bacterium]|nr:redox-sensing transcriptional repressor Rex [Acutalibacteraceae bacterium]